MGIKKKKFIFLILGVLVGFIVFRDRRENSQRLNVGKITISTCYGMQSVQAMVTLRQCELL